MRHLGLLAPVALLLTVAACGEPAPYEGELYDDATFAMTATSTVIVMPKLEICNDGVDNDGDGRIDRYDSDCGLARRTGPSIGYNEGITEGSDIFPDDYLSLTLDGARIGVEHRGTALVLSSSRGVFAVIHTDSPATAIAVGEGADRYQDILVVTEGGGAGYAPGRVYGEYELEDPITSGSGGSGVSFVPPDLGTICTIGC